MNAKFSLNKVKKQSGRLVLNAAAVIFFAVPVILLANTAYQNAALAMKTYERSKANEAIATSKVASQPVDVFVEPIVSVTFDDGWESVATVAAPILAKYNVATTHFIITGTTGKPGYMNVDQLKALRAAGHEIGSHTVDHVGLQNIPDNTAETQFADSKVFLHDHKLLSDAASFAFPYGNYDARTTDLGSNAFAALRNSDGGPLGGINVHDVNTKGMYNPRKIIGYGITKESTIAEIKQVLEVAVANNGWVVFIFHQVDEKMTDYSVSPKFLEQFLQLVQAEGIKTATVHDVVTAVKDSK